MNPSWHRRITKLFLVSNSMFWLPWGLLNLIKPKSWSGEVIPSLDVYDLSSPVARTEVRAMYGGLQMAIGTAALDRSGRDEHRDSALGFFVLALSGLSHLPPGRHGRRGRVAPTCRSVPRSPLASTTRSASPCTSCPTWSSLGCSSCSDREDPNREPSKSIPSVGRTSISACTHVQRRRGGLRSIRMSKRHLLRPLRLRDRR